MDTDNSGGLDSQEFCTAMKKLVQKLKCDSRFQLENKLMDISTQSCATVFHISFMCRISALLNWLSNHFRKLTQILASSFSNVGKLLH